MWLLWCSVVKKEQVKSAIFDITIWPDFEYVVNRVVLHAFVIFTHWVCLNTFRQHISHNGTIYTIMFRFQSISMHSPVKNLVIFLWCKLLDHYDFKYIFTDQTVLFQFIPPWTNNGKHYNDVIMSVMASQITSLMIVYSSVSSGANQRKHQSLASLAFVREIHRGPVISPHKGPVTRKMFSFDDVIMITDDFKCNFGTKCCLFWWFFSSKSILLGVIGEKSSLV